MAYYNSNNQSRSKNSSKKYSPEQQARYLAKSFFTFSGVNDLEDVNLLLVGSETHGAMQSIVDTYNERSGGEYLRLVMNNPDSEEDGYSLVCRGKDIDSINNNSFSRIYSNYMVEHPDTVEVIDGKKLSRKDYILDKHAFSDLHTTRTGRDSYPDVLVLPGFPANGTFADYRDIMNDSYSNFINAVKIDNDYVKQINKEEEEGIAEMKEIHDFFNDEDSSEEESAINETSEGVHFEESRTDESEDENKSEEDVVPVVAEPVAESDDTEDTASNDSASKSASEPEPASESNNVPVQNNSARQSLRNTAQTAQSRPISSSARFDTSVNHNRPKDAVKKDLSSSFSEAVHHAEDLESIDTSDPVASDKKSIKERFADIRNMVAVQYSKTEPFRAKAKEKLSYAKAAIDAGFTMMKARRFANKIADYSAFLEDNGMTVSGIKSNLKSASENGMNKESATKDASLSEAYNSHNADARVSVAYATADPARTFKEKAKRHFSDIGMSFAAVYATARVGGYENKVAKYQAKIDALDKYLVKPVSNKTQADTAKASEQTSVQADSNASVISDITEKLESNSRSGFYVSVSALRDYLDAVMKIPEANIGDYEMQSVANEISRAGSYISSMPGRADAVYDAEDISGRTSEMTAKQAERVADAEEILPDMSGYEDNDYLNNM